MSGGGQLAYVAELPPCGLHELRGERVEAAYDAKTRMGPWAYLCAPCFVEYGLGLGEGRGQRLMLREGQGQEGAGR